MQLTTENYTTSSLRRGGCLFYVIPISSKAFGVFCLFDSEQQTKPVRLVRGTPFLDCALSLANDLAGDRATITDISQGIATPDGLICRSCGNPMHYLGVAEEGQIIQDGYRCEACEEQDAKRDLEAWPDLAHELLATGQV